MYSDISVQLMCLIYVFILSMVYIFKRKYNFIESRIYKILLLLTLITLILDITSMCFIMLDIKLLILLKVIPKLYFVSILLWIITFMGYVLLNRSLVKYETFKELLRKNILAKSYITISLVFVVIIGILKVDYGINPITYYGGGVDLVYSLSIYGSIFLLIMLLFKSRKISNDKNFSILFSIIILCITFFIQINYKDIYVISGGLSLITLFLYFTIENPDIKYIDELNALKLKAEDANKAKTYFLASMSHEIRTPMNAIIGLSESLLSENIPKEIEEDIKNINKAGDTLLEIVNNILDITRIEEGRTTLKIDNYLLGDLIGELSNMVNSLLGEKPISFNVEILGNIPTELKGDKVKLYQILMNLLSNAVKYTNKGNIRLQIDSVILGSRATLTFKVIDTGIGIKKIDYEKLFQKFERLDQEQSTIQGTGLGLTITKKLVDMIGGKISFDSVYQKGSTFTVTVEQEIVNKEKITDLTSYTNKKRAVTDHFDGSKYEILLVDDNNLNLKVAEKLLKKYNLNVTSVKSGLECINYTKNKKYDLIFLDHMMPDMDGIHTLYNLKSRASGFDTPVVALTANAIEGSKDMYLKEGFCAYLSKPINQVELDKILKKWLEVGEEDDS